MNTKKRRLGNTQKKLLTLLLGGVGIGLTRDPRKHLKIISEASADLRELSKQNSERALTSLEKHKFIRLAEKRGYLTPHLTPAGKKLALIESLHEIGLKRPRKWDGFWRVVSFDIPEYQRNSRDAFRFHLNRLGFYEIHQSLFVTPYPCEDEIRYIAHTLEINRCVHTIMATETDNEKTLCRFFQL